MTPTEQVNALIKTITCNHYRPDVSGTNVTFFATADRHPWDDNKYFGDGDFVFTLAKAWDITWDEDEDFDITNVDGIEIFYDNEEDNDWVWDDARIVIEENAQALKDIFDIIEANWDDFNDMHYDTSGVVATLDPANL